MIVGVVFTSCEDDDTVANESLLNEPTQVKVEFTDLNDGTEVLEDGGTVALELSLSQALTYDAIGTIEVTSSDGSLETSPGVTEVTYTTTFALSAGETTATINLTFADDTLDDVSEVYTVTISNLESVDGAYPTTSFLLGGDTTRTINVLDNFATVVVTVVGDVTIIFTWDDGSDLDIRLRDSGLSTISTGYLWASGGSESVTLAETEPDDLYTVSIRPWDVADSEQNWTLEFVSPAGSEFFTGTLTNASSGWSQEDNILQIEKVTSGADVTYTLTQL